jgi:hypothetical protein
MGAAIPEVLESISRPAQLLKPHLADRAGVQMPGHRLQVVPANGIPQQVLDLLVG